MTKRSHGPTAATAAFVVTQIYLAATYGRLNGLTDRLKNHRFRPHGNRSDRRPNYLKFG